MANADNPSGARPIRHLTGAPYNGQSNRYCLPAADGTATYIHDLVKFGGTADADGIPTIAQAAAGDALLVGAVVGLEVSPTDLTLMYRSASTLRYAMVSDSPDIIYEMQEDSVGGALAATDVGENCDIIVAAGSATSGVSAMELDSSTHATTTAQMRVIRLVQRADNAIGTNAKWEVLINEHAFKSTTGT